MTPRTRNKASFGITKNCDAAVILRNLFDTGKATTNSDPDDVYSMNTEFQKHSEDRFAQIFVKTARAYGGKLFFQFMIY